MAMGPLTQEDPIGIAGGLNLYGYANGDPINFSDPFGLCPAPETENTVCIALFIAADGALGLAGDGREFSMDSDPSASRAYIHVDVMNQTFNVTVNESCTAGGAKCNEPLSRNRVDVKFFEGGGFEVSYGLKNSLIPGPSINGNLTFTPNASGSFSVKGSRDAFPSLEAYYHTPRGVHTLVRRPERTPFHLFWFAPNDIFRSR